jgi:hypothetical protein
MATVKTLWSHAMRRPRAPPHKCVTAVASAKNPLPVQAMTTA